MALFVLGIQEGPGFGWRSPVTIGSIVVGLAILGWLMWQQWRAADPLIDIRQVSKPGIGGDLFVLTLVQFALLGVVLYGTFYLQNIMGASPLNAGFMSLPLILGIAAGAQVGGSLFDSAGVRLPVLGGLALAAVGTAMWGVALLGTEYWPQVPGMIVGGLGIGLVLSPASTDAMSRADADKRRQISGLVQTVRQLGGTLGIAATGAVVLTLEPKGAVSAAARFPIAAAFVFSAVVLLLALAFGWFALARDRLTTKADAGAAAG